MDEFDKLIASIQVNQPYSRPQAAKMLNVHWDTVGTMIESGQLAFVLVGKRKKILGKEILRVLALDAKPVIGDTSAERRRVRDEILKEMESRTNRRGRRGPSGQQPG